MKAASPDFRHQTPDDLRGALNAAPALAEKWNGLTDLARNEWICWMISPKNEATRAAHFARPQNEVVGGKRRPCCWPGCPHRRESARKYLKA